METVKYDKENIKFMAKFERFEPLIHDHTSMRVAKDCLRKYFYQIVIAKIPKQDQIHFAWGRAYHKFREILEKSNGDLHLATNSGLAIWDKDQGGDPPVGSKFDFLTKARLMKSFGIAYSFWKVEREAKRIVVVAVEQPFNVALADGSHTSGRFDQVVRWSGKLWGRDFKTTSKEGTFYARTLEPNDQFTRYTFAESKLAGEPVQGQIIETLYNSKKEGPKITQYTSSRSQYQLDQWERDQIFMNKILAMAREEDTWPMQEHACQYCQYHSVCKLPSEGSMMAQLEAEYVTRPWDNTKNDD